ncbi:hypothetical protein ACQ27_gp542 [Klebsiella phage K64-1]|nr:hypothetical protein ACQ27_gp542 [Klebsiella phage K64-1]
MEIQEFHLRVFHWNKPKTHHFCIHYYYTLELQYNKDHLHRVPK